MSITKLALRVSLLATLLGCSASEPAMRGTLEQIKASGTLNLGYRDAAPPFSFPGPDGQPVGYSVDLCTKIADAIQKQLGANLRVNWAPVTADNRIDMVTQGKVDIECGTTTVSLSRQERVDFSMLTFVDGGGFLIKSGFNLRAPADLADKRIAVIPGTTTESALTKFLKDELVTAKLIPVKNHPEGRNAVENGSAEAFASDRGVLIGLVVTAKDPSSLAIPFFQFSYEPYAFMVRRNDADFRLAVNRALAELYRSGAIAQIYDRWFGVLGKPSTALQAIYLLNAVPE
jgi:glutamate/aspartate transport system substrate-binding protein